MATENVSKLIAMFRKRDDYRRLYLMLLQEQRIQLAGPLERDLSEKELKTYVELLTWNALSRLLTEQHEWALVKSINTIILHSLSATANTPTRLAQRKVNDYIIGEAAKHPKVAFIRGDGTDNRLSKKPRRL